jgi:hypothetical protein
MISLQYASLTPNEIRPGIALHLSPTDLRQYAGTSNLHPEEEVFGAHFFICIDWEYGDSLWIPASTKQAVGRCPILPHEKRGYRSWQAKNSYCNVREIWTLPNASAPEWSVCDHSTPGLRNEVCRVALRRLQLLASGSDL